MSGEDDQNPITDPVTGEKWPVKEHADPAAPDERLPKPKAQKAEHAEKK